MNIVILAGRLGADPELKYANSGTAILNLRLATESYRKGADGEGEKVTYWHTLTMFGRRAESLANILQKGTGITVRGEIRPRSYEKDGEKRWVTDIVVDDLELGARPAGDEGGAGRNDRRDDRRQQKGDDRRETRRRPPAQQRHDYRGDFNDDDDIPF